MNVVVGFVVVFTTPYLMNPAYAGLGANLGYVWGGFSALGAIWVWLCMPELKDRTLEEMDELFAARIPAWEFKGYKTSSLSYDMAVLKSNGDPENLPKATVVQLEDAQRD